MNRLLLLVLVTNLLLSAAVIAEENQLAVSTRQNLTMYVNDELWITVRTAPDINAEKIKVIKSGVSMTVLSHADDADYAQIRTEDGQTGWVLFRYLSPEPPATLQLVKAQQELAKLQEKFGTETAMLKELKSKTRNQNARLDDLERSKQTLETQLAEVRAASENVIETQQQNLAFQEQLKQQKTQLAELTSSNDTMLSRQLLFVAGAAIIGLLLGLFIGTIPLRRDKRWRSMP